MFKQQGLSEKLDFVRDMASGRMQIITPQEACCSQEASESQVGMEKYSPPCRTR